jgi:hypothetical protein
MRFSAPFRRLLQPALAALLLVTGASVGLSQPGVGQKALRPGGFGAHVGPPRQNQEHLAQWMERHSSLPLPQQQKALENEPGFRDLPGQTQQRMRDRLTQLNGMPPEQRRRIIERTEAMEHLSPPQRQQVRSAMQQLGGLPIDRRRQVARAFRDLREMPQPQRQALLNSDRFRGQFSEEERNTLSNLIAVEPYLPIQRANDVPPYGR